MSFTASDVLLKAASRIEEEGMWCQGPSAIAGLFHSDQPTCAAVALATVSTELGVPDTYEQALLLLTRAIGGTRPLDVPRWNDIPGRTAFEVAEAMRQAAL